jgi:hypothetical protein
MAASQPGAATAPGLYGHGMRSVAVAVIGLAALALTACGETSDESAPTNVWTAPGYTVNVPATFESALESATPIEKQLASRGLRVQFDLAFTEPDTVNQLLFGALISPAGTDLRRLSSRFRSLSASFAPDYRPVSGVRKTTIDGEPALYYEYTGKTVKGPVHVRLIFVSHHGHVYLTTLTSDLDTFEANANLYDEILRSWRWRLSSRA